jgi:hypothetical protein
MEDFLDADIFNTSRNLSSEIGILQSRTVVYDAAKNIHMDVSYFGNNTFSRKPLFKPCPFTVEYEWIQDNFYNQHFFLYPKENGTFDLKMENSTVSYEYHKSHRYNEKISTPYFTFSVLRNDSSPAFKEYNFYEFIIHSPQAILTRIKNNLNVAALNKDASIIRVTYHDNVKERAVEFLDALSSEYINRDIRTSLRWQR